MTLRTALEALKVEIVPGAEGAPLTVRPRDAAEAAEVVRACREAGARVDVISRHAGAQVEVTSREAGAQVDVTGRDPEAAGVVLDLGCFDAIALDEESHLVSVGAGVPVQRLETALRERGYTLGVHSLPERPVGAWLCDAEPGPGGARSLPGWSPVMGLEAVLGDGGRWRTRLAPRSATGPDLKALLVGGGGRVGVILSATLRVHRRPAIVRRLVFAFPDYAAGVGAAAEALGRDLFPDRFGLLDGGAGEAVLTWESHGEPQPTNLHAGVVDEVCVTAGGRRLSTEARTDAGEAPAADPGAAGPAELRARLDRPGDLSELAVLMRWSRAVLVRRALLNAFEGRPRLHLERALPEGCVAWAWVPEGHEEAAHKAVRDAGGLVPGDGEVDWYDAVGTVLDGGKR